MNNLKSTIKKGVFENKRYHLKAMNTGIKLNQNESPYDMPDEYKQKILDRLASRDWNRYPDFVPEKLYRLMSENLGVKYEQILIGNGSNEMITTIMTSILDRDKALVLPVPTFSVYKLIAGNLEADIKEIPLKSDLTFPVDELCNAAKGEGTLTVICSPNNPTGKTMSRSDIVKILEASGGVVVVDEAYIQFGGESVIDLIESYEHLVVLRTFSKAFGLAGLRLGIMIGNERIIEHFAKVKLPYNINLFTQYTAEVILENPEIITERIQTINKEKIRLGKKLAEIKGLKLIDSEANFFLIEVVDPPVVFDYLLSEGILIRDVSGYPMLDKMLRVSVGTPEENDILIEKLSKYYGE